jgi:hypothetical protein
VIGIQTPQEATSLYHLWTLEEINHHMWCECPDDYDGQLCEVPKEQCEDADIVCFHGGTCVAKSMVDGLGFPETDYHCDCTTASTDDTDLLAGRYCQYEATSVCHQNDDNLL